MKRLQGHEQQYYAAESPTDRILESVSRFNNAPFGPLVVRSYKLEIRFKIITEQSL